MVQGARRRSMVFVDGSALRDAINEHYRDLIGRYGTTLHARLHYQKFGILLCGDERDFVRLNYYTGEPVSRITPRTATEPAKIGEIRLGPHEFATATRKIKEFKSLRDHIDTSCRFTSFSTGRLISRRVRSSIEDALAWARGVFMDVDPALVSSEDRALITELEETSRKTNELRRRLADKILGMYQEGEIPRKHMGWFSRRVSELQGSFIDYTEKGVDILLAVDMLSLCMDGAYDDAILFAADEDYVPVVKAVMRTGRCVVNAFLDIPGNPTYGFHLRKACDDYRSLTKDDIESLIVSDNAHLEPVERSSCRWCREAVHAGAVRCPHCQSDLSAEAPSQAEPETPKPDEEAPLPNGNGVAGHPLAH